MITLKNNKLPKLHLKLNKYEIAHDNESVTEYRKTIYSKDEYNYAMVYYIHIFYHKKDDWSDVCVSTKEYNTYANNWSYDWYSGDYEAKSWQAIDRLDNKLLKYLEVTNERKRRTI